MFRLKLSFCYQRLFDLPCRLQHTQAVAVLLTLLHLGITNIRLGPNMPVSAASAAAALCCGLRGGWSCCPVRTPPNYLMLTIPIHSCPQAFLTPAATQILVDKVGGWGSEFSIAVQAEALVVQS